MKKILMILVIAMLAALPVSAQIPRLINYQGVLTDDMGAVVSDGDYSMTFRLYDVDTGGSPLWEETLLVTVSKGIFNVTLGNVTMIYDPFFKDPVYLGIEISGGGELTPRRPFTASAYAFGAMGVHGEGNVFPSEGSVSIGTTTPEAPFHILRNISSFSDPMVLLDNAGSQTLIDFRFDGTTQARIRKAYNGDLFLGTLNFNGISFSFNNTAVHKMASDGSFGIDNLSPLEKLDVNGAIRLGTTVNNNAGTLRWTGSDFEGYDGDTWHSLTVDGGSSLPDASAGETLRHNGLYWEARSNLYNSGTDIGIGTTSPVINLHIKEDVNAVVGIRIENLDTGSGSGEQISFVDENGTVAGIRLYDDTNVGSYSGSMIIYNNRPSGSLLFKTGGLNRMRILNSGDVAITGSSGSAVFDMSNSGNASVSLPVDAVSSTEILDEPGTASATSNTSTVIGTTASVLLFRNITVPDDGYVFVIGTTQAQIGHGTGTSSTLNVGVSDNPTVLPDNQDVGWLIPANSATATYTLPITVQGLFEVSAGDNSFYLLGRSATASASMYGLDKQLTLIYIPTNYGTVAPTLVSSSLADSDVPTDRGMSTGDMSAERAASIDANNDRIERELTAMRDRIAALEKELGNK